MKKDFLTPSINITKFDAENIVTEASQITNTEAAKNKLLGEGVDIEKILEYNLVW